MLTTLRITVADRLAGALAGGTGYRTLADRLAGLGEAWRLWRHERDVRAIERALAGLSKRQLRLIGMSRGSIAAEVRGLIERTEAGRAMEEEVLRLLDRRPRPVPLLPHAA